MINSIIAIIMVAILPISFITMFAFLYEKNKKVDTALSLSIFLFEGLMIVMANLLSIGNLLSRVSVFLFWLIVAGFFLVFGQKKYGKEFLRFDRKIQYGCKSIWQSIAAFTFSEKLMLLLMGVFTLILLFGVLFTTPYNYDSMTYHLARIGYWMDHGNVNYYVTTIDRQLFSPVLSEYNLLAVMLLCQNDYLVNFQQFISMLFTAYFMYKVTRMLGTGRLFSLFASLAFITMPLTITQAVTTQNDLSATLFFVLFLYELMWFIQTESINEKLMKTQGKEEKIKEALVRGVLTGACIGFAFLMKVSVCASMVMFMPWLLVVCVKRKDSILSLCKVGIAAVASMLVVMSETLIRTYMSCHSLMAKTTSGDIMVATKNVSYILVNILKNYSLLITQHFWTALNGFVYRIAIHLGALLHVEVNNIAIAYHGFDFIKYLNTGDDMYSHDRTSSAFVAYLALIAGVLLVVALIQALLRRMKKQSVMSDKNLSLSYGFVISAWLSFGFIMALLRWQPWGSRLMFPALSMTVIASMHILDYFCKKEMAKQIVLYPLIALSILLCIRPITYNLQPAFDFVAGGFENRDKVYFENNKRYDTYVALLDRAVEESVTDVGVVISGDGYDYPLWAMFHKYYPQAKLRHILIDDTNMKELNLTAEKAPYQIHTNLEMAGEMPEMILWIERGRVEEGETLSYYGREYECVFTADSEKAPDSVFLPVN